MGFTIKEFYCCGDLKSVSVVIADDTKGECNKGNEKRGCCDNKFDFFKVKDNHFVGDKITIPAKYFTDLVLFTPSYQSFKFNPQTVNVANRSNAPPLHSGTPIYIYNCVFRI